MRRPLALAVLLAIAVAFVLGADAARLDGTALASTFFDDAFYYLQIARQLVTGHGFTFDGIHRTNGFQPLWLFLLMPIVRALPGDFAPLYAVVALQTALVAVAAVGLFVVLRPRIGDAGAFAAGLLLVAQPNAKVALASGMETPLVLAFLVMAWLAWSRQRWLLLGVVGGALLWTRLEAGLVAPVALVLARDRLRHDRRRLMALCLPFAIAAVTYVAWNQLAFHTWLPISGMVKLNRIGPPWHHYWRALSETPWIGHEIVCRLSAKFIFLAPAPVKIAYVALTTATIALGLRFRHALAQAIRDADAVLPLAVCVVVWLAQLATLLSLDAWHNYPLLLATALLGGIFVARARRWAMPLTAALAVVAFAHALARHAERALVNEIDCVQQALDWVGSNVPAGAPIGSWNAGRFAWFSRHAIVNLDGLVNDERFYSEVIAGHRIEQYLARENIDWLIDYYPLSLSQPDAPALDEQFPQRASFCDVKIFRRR
jgi:hypothetical protein